MAAENDIFYGGVGGKTNVIKRLIIPRLDITIRYILSELDEREREDTFRLRRIKQHKVKKAKGDGAGEQIDVADEFEKEERVPKPLADKYEDKAVKAKPMPDDKESVNVQPKEAAEMGDLIMIKPPDDKLEIGDAFIPSQMQTNGTKTEVDELNEKVPDYGDKEKLEYESLDDKNIQKEEVSVRSYRDNLETGEWFETPSKLQNIAEANENLPEYSKLDKFEDVQREVSKTKTMSAAKTSLTENESIIDLDKKALASLYKGIDSNFYQTTLDDIMSKHDIAMKSSISLQDISILEHSLIDIESIDFSMDSKGNVVLSKHGTGQSSPALSTHKKADGTKISRDVNDDLPTASAGRSANVGKDIMPTVVGGNKSESQFKNQNDENNIKTKIDRSGNDDMKLRDELRRKKSEIDEDDNHSDRPKASLEETEMRSSVTEQIRKKSTFDSIKTDINKKDKSVESNEKLSRITEEDNVELIKTSKLSTYIEESKEIQNEEIKEKEGSIKSDKFEDSVSSFHDIEKLSVVSSSKPESMSTSQMPLKAANSITDLDRRALSSLYKGIDSNYYEPILDDIMSKHDIAMKSFTSLQDVPVIDESLIDLESIDFSINSKGNVVPSMHDTRESLPALPTNKALGGPKVTENFKDDLLTASTAKTTSVRWLGDGSSEENLMEKQFKNESINNLKDSQHEELKNGSHPRSSGSVVADKKKKSKLKSLLLAENKNIDEAETSKDIDKFVEPNENVSEYSKLDNFDKVVDLSKTESTSAIQMSLKATESITDLDKRALSSLYKGIDNNFYETTLDDIMSKHDIAMRESSDKSIDHSYADLESLDFSINSKGNVVLSMHDTGQSSPALSTNRDADVPKITSQRMNDLLAASTDAVQNRNVSENLDKNVLESAIAVDSKTTDTIADTGIINPKPDGTANDEIKLDKSRESLESKELKVDNNEKVNNQLNVKEIELENSNVEQTPKESTFDKIKTEHHLGNNPVELKTSRNNISDLRNSREHEQNTFKLDTSKLSILVEVSKESQFDEERDVKDITISEKLRDSKSSFHDSGKSLYDDPISKDNQNFDRIEKGRSEVIKNSNDSNTVEKINSQENLKDIKKVSKDISESKMADIKEHENEQLKALNNVGDTSLSKIEEAKVSSQERHRTEKTYMDSNSKMNDATENETDEETKHQESKLLKVIDSNEIMQAKIDSRRAEIDEHLKLNNKSNANQDTNDKTERDSQDQKEIEKRKIKENSIAEHNTKQLKIQNSDENVKIEEDKVLSDDSQSKELKTEKELTSDNERSSSDTNKPGRNSGDDHIKQE